MKNPNIVIDALIDKIAALEQEKLDLDKKWDAKYEKQITAYSDCVVDLARSMGDKGASWITLKEKQLASCPEAEIAKFAYHASDFASLMAEYAKSNELYDFSEKMHDIHMSYKKD